MRASMTSMAVSFARRALASEAVARGGRDTIVLKGLSFFGRHGVLKEEEALGQKFVVDLKLGCCLESAGRTDDVTRTVDYAAVYRTVKEIVEGRGRRHELVESLASTIVASVFRGFEQVEHVDVFVKKPQVALMGELEYAGVRMLRTRDEVVGESGSGSLK
ncbi:dihydroneopterin aldolase [Chloropicon primus]|uniref:7,8-dihydroneopterin aldolase n=1 Tax=Chloropicon primus TaxID=1764295 RepID=A0A5B8MCY3_9CHLO|nr:dihydroneopterin aldolase [Chloropicon primus]UPQ97179.1 dihydroneopterin aldolase [Chloropicon primus]|eukprot:QDZ17964.1 dihydroneopterin aldolase [Chloropicon primus]